MNENPAASDWVAARGEKWCAQLSGMESTFMPIDEPLIRALQLEAHSDSDKFLALLDRAGFAKLDVRDWRGALPIGGGLPPAEAAHFAISSFSSFGELLAKAGDDALNEARRSLTTCFSHHQQDGAVRLDASVRIFTGARRSPPSHEDARLAQ